MDNYTRAIILVIGVLGILAAVGVLIFYREALIQKLKEREKSESWLVFGEFLFTILSTGIATHFTVWELEFKQHPLRTPMVLATVVFFVFLAFYYKWLRDRVKDRDKEKLTVATAQFQQQFATLTAKLNTTEILLERHRRLGNQITGLVTRKIVRVREVAKKASTSVEDLIARDARENQIHTILRSIHDFFDFELKQTRPEGKMRIYLYVPEDLPDPRMLIFYKWNGQDEDCVIPPPEAMKLMSPQGVQSEIVRTYHLPGSARLALVPNCLTEPGFAKLVPNQDEYLKSMLSFKYKYHKDGAEAALVLSLDCDEPDFFSNDRFQEISHFLVEMLKRFEYEMLGLEIVAKLPPPLPKLLPASTPPSL